MTKPFKMLTAALSWTYLEIKKSEVPRDKHFTQVKCSCAGHILPPPCSAAGMAPAMMNANELLMRS